MDQGIEPGPPPIALKDYQPRSMLHVPVTKRERALYPAIDFHTHLAWSSADGHGPVKWLGNPSDWIAVMDRKNVRAMVQLTGGFGEYLDASIRDLQQAYPDRFYVFTEPMWSHTHEPGYARAQADEIERAAKAGARGLKVLKTLGLFLRDSEHGGSLVKVDDPRFDPMWEVCGALGLPVGIHVSDPEAFFLPIDRFNERYEELHNHPDWSFCGRDFPSDRELQRARERVMARHPKTQFVVLHVGNNAENLDHVSAGLDCFPNMYVDIAARIGELGRQPRAARRGSGRCRNAATDFLQRVVRDLLSLSRNGRRVLRLRPGASAAARPLAHLWTRLVARSAAEGLL